MQYSANQYIYENTVDHLDTDIVLLPQTWPDGEPIDGYARILVQCDANERYRVAATADGEDKIAANVAQWDELPLETRTRTYTLHTLPRALRLRSVNGKIYWTIRIIRTDYIQDPLEAAAWWYRPESLTSAPGAAITSWPDTSPAGNDGVAGATQPTHYPAGILGGSIVIQNGQQARTLSLALYNAQSTSGSVLFGGDIEIALNGATMTLKWGTSTHVLTDLLPLHRNHWLHLVRDAAEIRVYVDGVLAQTLSDASAYNTSGDLVLSPICPVLSCAGWTDARYPEHNLKITEYYAPFAMTPPVEHTVFHMAGVTETALNTDLSDFGVFSVYYQPTALPQQRIGKSGRAVLRHVPDDDCTYLAVDTQTCTEMLICTEDGYQFSPQDIRTGDLLILPPFHNLRAIVTTDRPGGWTAGQRELLRKWAWLQGCAREYDWIGCSNTLQHSAYQAQNCTSVIVDDAGNRASIGSYPENSLDFGSYGITAPFFVGIEKDPNQTDWRVNNSLIGVAPLAQFKRQVLHYQYDTLGNLNTGINTAYTAKCTALGPNITCGGITLDTDCRLRALRNLDTCSAPSLSVDGAQEPLDTEVLAPNDALRTVTMHNCPQCNTDKLLAAFAQRELTANLLSDAITLTLDGTTPAPTDWQVVNRLIHRFHTLTVNGNNPGEHWEVR